jgi:purine-binding chemotaxis protein CheW
VGEDHVVVCRIGARRCALSVAAVIETMRPLPIERVAGASETVLGIAVIRGTPTPVVDVGALFETRTHAPGRFVTIRTAGRVVALAVDEVIGVSVLDRASLQVLPPLLGDARTSAIESIGSADEELLLVLRSARLAPPEAFTGPAT